MKKIFTLIAILICFIQTFAQKQFKVEKIVYHQKYDTFWSVITVKDINTHICYNRDTLFTEFPSPETFVVGQSSEVKLYYNDTTLITHTFIKTEQNNQVCTLECIWKNNTLMKVIVTHLDKVIEYIIRT